MALDAESNAVNAAVARITGLSKKFFEDTGSEEEPLFESAPSPMNDLAPKRPVARGDNADYQPYMPPKDKPSQSLKSPKQKMPPKEPEGDIYGTDDTDSDYEPVSSARGESRMSKSNTNSVNMVIEEYCGGMDEFRHYAGITEGETGAVPTAGVDKENMMTGGLPGLEGQSLQKIEPEAEHLGDQDGTDKEMTLDQAIAMLKKENIDTDALWSEFLENRGLTVELFSQLVDEAADAAEMDQLLAVEGLFVKALPNMLPEWGMMKKRAKKAKMKGMKMMKGMKGHEDRKAMSIEKMGKMKKESKDVKFARKPLAESRFTATNDELNDMSVRPRDYRKLNKMESLMAKYDLVSEELWIKKAIKKPGALHKELGVPQGKKIPQKKLMKAAHAGGKEGKRARLAMTLKKMHKK